MVKTKIEDKNGFFSPVTFIQKENETLEQFEARFLAKYKELFMKYNKNNNKLYITSCGN